MFCVRDGRGGGFARALLSAGALTVGLSFWLDCRASPAASQEQWEGGSALPTASTMQQRKAGVNSSRRRMATASEVAEHKETALCAVLCNFMKC